MEKLSLVRGIVESIVNILYEFKNAKKTTGQLKCRVIMHYPYAYAETHWGLVNEAHTFAIIPSLMRCYMGKPAIKFEILDGIKTLHVSSNYHATLDLDRLRDFADRQTYEAVLEIPHLRNWVKLKVEGVTGTFNFDLWDNDFSSDFTADTFKVYSGKLLQFLDEVPKRVFLLSVIIAGLVGLVIGFIGQGIISIILAMVFK